MSTLLSGINPLHQSILVGIPLSGRLWQPEFGLALATVRWPTGAVMQFSTTRGLEVGEARNQIAEHALKVGAKYVWFIDDDTAPPSFALLQLIYALEQHAAKNPEHPAMACAGIYCAKADPPTPIVYVKRGEGSYWNWKFNDVFECSAIGTGCMLINTEIFKILPKPWFRTLHEQTNSPLSVLELGVEKTYPKADLLLTDDIYFCYNVVDAGYKVLAHGGVLPIHWDTTTQTPYSLAHDSYPMIPREKEPEKQWNAFEVSAPQVDN